MITLTQSTPKHQCKEQALGITRKISEEKPTGESLEQLEKIPLEKQSVDGHNSVRKVFLFCWQKTIAASSTAVEEYYNGLDFKDWILNRSTAYPKLLKLNSLVTRQRLMPSDEVQTCNNGPLE